MSIERTVLQETKKILRLESNKFIGYINSINNKITSVSLMTPKGKSIIRCSIPKEFTKLKAIHIFIELRDMCNKILEEIDK